MKKQQISSFECKSQLRLRRLRWLKYNNANNFIKVKNASKSISINETKLILATITEQETRIIGRDIVRCRFTKFKSMSGSSAQPPRWVRCVSPVCPSLYRIFYQTVHQVRTQQRSPRRKKKMRRKAREERAARHSTSSFANGARTAPPFSVFFYEK